MGLLWLLLIGLIAGWLAGKIMKGSGYGMIGDLVLGIVGAMLGGHVFGWFGIVSYGFIGDVIVATVGAILLVVLIRLIKRA
jgi:uncharacterized membrane protein YeaQ/YmgE (transglycosylase-associated protein family)